MPLSSLISALDYHGDDLRHGSLYAGRQPVAEEVQIAFVLTSTQSIFKVRSSAILFPNYPSPVKLDLRGILDTAGIDS